MKSSRPITDRKHELTVVVLVALVAVVALLFSASHRTADENLVGYGSLSFSKGGIFPVKNVVTCDDPDLTETSKDKGLMKKTVATEMTNGKVTKSSEDVCVKPSLLRRRRGQVTTNQVQEAFCSKDRVYTKAITCPQGMVCSDGACVVETTTTCTDGDDSRGANALTRGMYQASSAKSVVTNTLTNQIVSTTQEVDVCVSRTELKEAVCGVDGTATTELVTCLAGEVCVAGKCEQAPPEPVVRVADDDSFCAAVQAYMGEPCSVEGHFACEFSSGCTLLLQCLQGSWTRSAYVRTEEEQLASQPQIVTLKGPGPDALSFTNEVCTVSPPNSFTSQQAPGYTGYCSMHFTLPSFTQSATLLPDGTQIKIQLSTSTRSPGTTGQLFGDVSGMILITSAQGAVKFQETTSGEPCTNPVADGGTLSSWSPELCMKIPSGQAYKAKVDSYHIEEDAQGWYLDTVTLTFQEVLS